MKRSSNNYLNTKKRNLEKSRMLLINKKLNKDSRKSNKQNLCFSIGSNPNRSKQS